MAPIAAHLNAGVILVMNCSDRHNLPLVRPPYPLPTPQPPFSQSRISLVVSVDVTHHVYLLTEWVQICLKVRT